MKTTEESFNFYANRHNPMEEVLVEGTNKIRIHVINRYHKNSIGSRNLQPQTIMAIGAICIAYRDNNYKAMTKFMLSEKVAQLRGVDCSDKHIKYIGSVLQTMTFAGIIDRRFIDKYKLDINAEYAEVKADLESRLVALEDSYQKYKTFLQLEGK